MGIKYGTKGYNIGTVEVSTKLVAGESVAIGDAKDYNRIVDFAETGILKIKATIDLSGTDADFDGTVVCNKCPNGIEFSTITYFGSAVTGGDPTIVGGQIYMDGTALKCHVTAVEVS